MAEKIAKSKPIQKKIYMTKKMTNENTTNLKFSSSKKSGNSMPASIVAVLEILKTPEKDDVSTAFASTFIDKNFSYKLQNC
jgi:hypothetical protein